MSETRNHTLLNLILDLQCRIDLLVKKAKDAHEFPGMGAGSPLADMFQEPSASEKTIIRLTRQIDKLEKRESKRIDEVKILNDSIVRQKAKTKIYR